MARGCDNGSVTLSLALAVMVSAVQTGRVDLPPIELLRTLDDEGVSYFVTAAGSSEGIRLKMLADPARRAVSPEELFDLLFLGHEIPGLRSGASSADAPHTLAAIDSVSGRIERTFVQYSADAKAASQSVLMTIRSEVFSVPAMAEKQSLRDGLVRSKRKIGDESFESGPDRLLFRSGRVWSEVRSSGEGGPAATPREGRDAIAIALDFRISRIAGLGGVPATKAQLFLASDATAIGEGFEYRGEILASLDTLAELGVELELVCDRVHWRASLKRGGRRVHVEAYSWTIADVTGERTMKTPAIVYGGELLVPLLEVCGALAMKIDKRAGGYFVTLDDD